MSASLFPDLGSLYTVDRAGTRYALDDDRWRGADGSPLLVGPAPAPTPDTIDPAERSLWRYGAAIPVDPAFRTSLGEGCTPMVPLEWNGARVHAKLEWFNPTSSFKDRGVAVMVSHLRSRGARRVLEDSSGNGGSSVAAYAAAAGLDAKILVPAATSEAKVLMVKAFGAEIELVGGTRDEVSAEAIRQSAEIPYASHAWHPMFLEGTKTIAYEMWESLGFTAPDNVVVVAGGGSNVLWCDVAFTELLAAGLIEKRPRLFLGQPEHFAPIADTVNGLDPLEALAARTEARGADGLPARTPSMAEGSSIASPVRLPETVEAVHRSGGGAVAVSEEEIASATRDLVRRGLYAEPTSAVGAAALTRFQEAGVITPEQTTVLILTGTGLKSAERMAALY